VATKTVEAMIAKALPRRWPPENADGGDDLMMVV
jgi:hypothetical protein